MSLVCDFLHGQVPCGADLSLSAVVFEERNDVGPRDRDGGVVGGQGRGKLSKTLLESHWTPPPPAKADALLVCATLDPESNSREAGVACSGTANDRMPGQKTGERKVGPSILSVVLSIEPGR